MLPVDVTAAKLFGSWATLIEQAGFPRPTQGTRYKDSSGPTLTERPVETTAAPDEQEPAAVATTTAPAPLPHETPPRVEIRAALIGVLNSLRTLVDAVLPEPPE